MADPNKRTVPRQRSWLPIILILLLLALGLGIALWYYSQETQEPAVTTAEPTEPETVSPQVEPVIPEPITEVEPEPATAEGDECAVVGGRLEEFFNRLDQRDYIRQRQLAGGSRAHLERLWQRLLDTTPAVSGETSDIQTILANTAHFYRVLGKDDLGLLKDVMTREAVELEEILSLFYRWTQIAPDCPDSDLEFDLPLPAAYEYAGFFLDTMGGRSYLFRRTARRRLLATYYSVLILDRANEAGINRHGLDIRPAINSLLEEMPGVDSLRQSDEYLATLTELEDKYRRQYGQ